MLMCVFAHSRSIENPPIESWEINPCFFRGGLSHQWPLPTRARSLPPAHGEVAARVTFTSTDRPEQVVSPPLEPWWSIPTATETSGL
jgi:hypothetical protein